MTPDDFKAWRERMTYNRTQAAEALGIGRNTPQRYEDGETEIPLYIELACKAIEQMNAPPIPPDHIEVFDFIVYDPKTDETIKGSSKRDRDFIEKFAKGEVLEGTGEIVHKSKLDSYGRYYPKKTRLL